MTRAPHPALRALYASGGAPQAFVARDEALAGRLVRVTTERAAAFVAQGERIVDRLLQVPDLTRLATMAHRDEAREPTPGEEAIEAVVRGVRRSRGRAGATRGRGDGRDATRPSGGLLTALGDAAGRGGLLAKALEMAQGGPTAAREGLSGAAQAMGGEPTTRRAGTDMPGIFVPRPRGGLETLLMPVVDPLAGVVAAGERTARQAVAAILGRAGASASSPAAAREGARGAASGRGRDEASPARTLASQAADALQRAVDRAERSRASAGAESRRHAGRSPREAADDGAAIARGVGGAVEAVRRAQDTSRSPSDRQEHPSVATRLTSEPVAPVGGFRGLARWAAEQAGDLETSAAIDRSDRERAPMLQRLHATRRGWDLADDGAPWSLDAAARTEGIDLDEVAT